MMLLDGTVRGRAGPVACVLGDMDIVRPLAMEGVRCWVAGPPGRPPRFSRFVDGAVELPDPWVEGDEVVRRLTDFAETQPESPVLFYEDDGFLALVSRHRRKLSASFRFVIPRSRLVEDLIDKARFLDLARRLALPIPPSCHLIPGTGALPSNLTFPFVIKPLTRDDRDGGWTAIGGPAKAVRINTPAEFRTRVPRVEGPGICLLAQSLIPGPETAVESYHVYAADGQIIADFTGKKIRTLPTEFGFSTALTTSDAPDLLQLGRRLVRLLELDGVAKMDFKRDLDGDLHLLEVNPRFTLWNHLGARAGVNLPWLVYADLTGMERGEVGPARAGVTWCDLPKDFRAATSLSLPLRAWIKFAATADIKADLAWDDPAPFLRGRLLSRLTKTVRHHGGSEADAAATSSGIH